MGILNQNGYESTSYAEKRAALVEVFKQAFGDTLRTDEESAQGQIIDYIASLVNNEDKIGLSIFNGMNYRNARGVTLSLIAISKGQPRRSGTKAIINCDFTSSQVPYAINIGSIFKDTVNSLQFTNESLINITTLTQSGQLIASKNGKTDLIITNTLTAETYLPNLTNIEITSIQDGTEDETDEELIERLSNSDSETGVNDVNAVFDRISANINVSRVTVIENDTDATVDGVPAHGIEALAVGGTDQEIAEAVFIKASGTPTSGNTSATVFDSQGFPRIINFGRPNIINGYAKIRLTQREGQPISVNEADLKQKTMNYINTLRIGKDISRTPIFGIWGGGNFDIDYIGLSTNGVTFVETNIAIGTREYALVNNLSQIIVEYV